MEHINAPPITVSVADAAKFSGLSQWSIRDLIYKGILDARRHGRRVLVVYRSLVDYLESLEEAA